MHAGGFRPAFSYGAIDNSIGATVVILEESGWLGMAHLGEDGTDNDPPFGIKNSVPSSALVEEDKTILMI